MPLPLPNLDTRTWADLVDEGRALIPRYSQGWTDHNYHDPGVTLMEMLAWLVEQDIYRANRITARDRLKFLYLAGFGPQPPLPAHTVLALTLQPPATALNLPAGIAFAATAGGVTAPFRTRAGITVVAGAIAAVQSFDGAAFADRTRAWRSGTPFQPWGPNPPWLLPSDPAAQPALYLGFQPDLPPGVPVSLWLRVAGLPGGWEERARIVEEATRMPACAPPPAADCPPPGGGDVDPLCPPETVPPGPVSKPPALPAHHAVRTVWEYYDGSGWRALDPGQGQVVDDTRSLTLDGAVIVTLPGPAQPVAVGAVAAKLCTLRCRVAEGPFDFAPVLAEVSANAVPVEQSSPARATFVIRPGVLPPASRQPVPGQVGQLTLALDSNGGITQLAVDPPGSGTGPAPLVLAYIPATATAEGSLTVTLVQAGWGTGLPDQVLALPGAPVAGGEVELWTLEASWRSWSRRPDLDASTRADAHFTLDAMVGLVAPGDGEHGRVVPAGVPVFAAYDVCAGQAGNLPAGATWSFVGADDVLNGALLGPALPGAIAALGAMANRAPAAGGADAEDPENAAGRAVAVLWAHERLLELCPAVECQTLDGHDRAIVLSRPAPSRATTLLDYERLALDVPGAAVARSRAWAGIDPSYPCLKAPGTVAVVIVPWLPLGRPRPGTGLIEAVRRYLDRRRGLGTGLVVVGPDYLQVSVQASVSVVPGVRLDRVQAAVSAALDAFLDPLAGGPGGHGWPFGRSVYQAEILDVIARTPGVDHVLSLELRGDSGPAQCGNLCVGPTGLVTPGAHSITVA